MEVRKTSNEDNGWKDMWKGRSARGGWLFLVVR